MKDVKVYDGSGWQSLKGPPGPSTPSADAGNIITQGSDGLLRVTGETQFSGLWAPVGVETGGNPTTGYWTRVGRAVTVTVQCDLEAGGSYSIYDLPFSAAPYYEEQASSAIALFSAPVLNIIGQRVGGLAVLSASTNTIEIYYYDDQLGTPGTVGVATFTLTYLTDDPPLR